MIDIRHSSENVPSEDLTVRTRNRCDDCENSYICKYVDPYMKAVDDLRSIDLPDTMKIEVSCKHYKDHMESPRVFVKGRNICSRSNSISKVDRGTLDDIVDEGGSYAD